MCCLLNFQITTLLADSSPSPWFLIGDSYCCNYLFSFALESCFPTTLLAHYHLLHDFLLLIPIIGVTYIVQRLYVLLLHLDLCVHLV